MGDDLFEKMMAAVKTLEAMPKGRAFIKMNPAAQDYVKALCEYGLLRQREDGHFHIQDIIDAGKKIGVDFSE